MDWGSILRNTVSAGIGPDAIIYAIAAIGLNVHFGYTGLLNFGQAGFMAIGAYGMGVAVTFFNTSLWLGLGAGLLTAVVLALILGIPTLRLRADYLAITTIAASEIIRLTVRSVYFAPETGGSFGLQNFADAFYRLDPFHKQTYEFGPFRYSGRDLWVVVIGWSLAALISFLVFLLMRSPWGRVLRSIREDEDAARSLGKNVYGYKMQSLVLGGVIGAAAGMVFAVAAQSIQPESYLPAITFFGYAVLILGGTARVLGPIAGSIVFWLIVSFTDNFLRGANASGLISSSIIDGNQIGQVRFMLVGIGLMLLMIFRPQGIFGNRNEIALDAR